MGDERTTPAKEKRRKRGGGGRRGKGEEREERTKIAFHCVEGLCLHERVKRGSVCVCVCVTLCISCVRRRGRGGKRRGNGRKLYCKMQT